MSGVFYLRMQSLLSYFGLKDSFETIGDFGSKFFTTFLTILMHSYHMAIHGKLVQIIQWPS